MPAHHVTSNIILYTKLGFGELSNKLFYRPWGICQRNAPSYLAVCYHHLICLSIYWVLKPINAYYWSHLRVGFWDFNLGAFFFFRFILVFVFVDLDVWTETILWSRCQHASKGSPRPYLFLFLVFCIISVFSLEYRTPLFEVRHITCQLLIFHTNICLSFLRFLVFLYMNIIYASNYTTNFYFIFYY